MISLILNGPYPVDHAKKINIKYGPTVLLPIRDVDKYIVDIFLPKRYANIVKDDDAMEDASGRAVSSLKVNLWHGL